MTSSAPSDEALEHAVWPFVRQVVDSWAVPGLAVAVVHDGDQVATRGFGTRTGHASDPVTVDTLFHLASISKCFVATAAMRLIEHGELDLQGPVTSYLPGLAWADARANRVTVGQLLSHTSGIGDVSDYGWHQPQTDDEALARFAARVADWQLDAEPGAGFSYSNAAYELLGHLIATVSGQTFEAHLKQHVLDPVGMTSSTFMRAEVPEQLGALPHHGLPPRVLDDCYPYTRAHAPSSTLHSSAAELGTWIVAQLAGLGGTGVMRRETHSAMWRPQVEVEGWGEWYRHMARGWFWGEYHGHAVISHSGSDPGFETNLQMVPRLGIGLAVLANTNTAPIFGVSRGILDAMLGRTPKVPPPPVTVALGEILTASGVDAAVAQYRLMAAADPVTVDLDEEGFEEAAWGAIEMHRPEVVADVLSVWRTIHPESSTVAFMTGWTQLVQGRRDQGIAELHRALELDPDNDDAQQMLRRPPEVT